MVKEIYDLSVYETQQLLFNKHIIILANNENNGKANSFMARVICDSVSTSYFLRVFKDSKNTSYSTDVLKAIQSILELNPESVLIISEKNEPLEGDLRILYDVLWQKVNDHSVGFINNYRHLSMFN